MVQNQPATKNGEYFSGTITYLKKEDLPYIYRLPLYNVKSVFIMLDLKVP